MDYSISAGLAFNMADRWVLQKFIATAGYTAKKADKKDEYKLWCDMTKNKLNMG